MVQARVHPRSVRMEQHHVSKSLPIPDILTVYGGDWCWDCRIARRYLDSHGVDYRYIDLGKDRAAQALLDEAGYRAVPVIVTSSGSVLVEPSERELAGALGIGAA